MQSPSAATATGTAAASQARIPATAGLVHCSPVFNYSLRLAMVPTTVLPFLLDPSDRSQVTLQNGGVRRQVWWHLTVNLSPPLQPTPTIG